MTSELPTVQLDFWDQYHLVQKNWPEFFGGSYNGVLHRCLQGMVYAKSEEVFQASFEGALDAVMCNPKFVDYINN